jgi:hypothetical protein
MYEFMYQFVMAVANDKVDKLKCYQYQRNQHMTALMARGPGMALSVRRPMGSKYMSMNV